MGSPVERRAVGGAWGMVVSVVALALITGCQAEGVMDAAGPDDLAVTLSAVPEGSPYPKELRVTCRNISGKSVRLPDPQPLGIGAEPVFDQSVPVIVLGLAFPPEINKTCWPVYCSDRRPRVAITSLKPGQTWSKTYPFEVFHLYGPCGAAEAITEDLRSGLREIPVRAVLVFVAKGTLDGESPDTEDKTVYSSPMSLRCQWPDWMNAPAEDPAP
jgi:hypothetical protein